MRTFFGVVFALLALFCGGCSVLFIPMFRASNLGDVIAFLAIGFVPALVFGVIAARLLRRKPGDPSHLDPWTGKPHEENANRADPAPVPSPPAEPPQRSAYEASASKRIDDLPDEEIDERQR